jgi:hypothetical protein
MSEKYRVVSIPEYSSPFCFCPNRIIPFHFIWQISQSVGLLTILQFPLPILNKPLPFVPFQFIVVAVDKSLFLKLANRLHVILAV